MASAHKSPFKSYFLDGVLLVLLGLAMLLWPGESLRVLCTGIGIALAALGLIKLIVFLAGRGGERSAGDLLVGLIQIALGAALILRADFFIGIFQIVTGVLLLYGSILMFVQAFLLRRTRGVLFVLALVFACVTAVLAVVILLNPVQFAAFITQLHGVSLIVEGAGMILVMRRVKKN